MFYYLKGTVAHLDANLVVMDCGGVGYACRTTSYTQSALKVGEQAKVFTHLYVREDAMELFGFATQEELNLFQQLISVSGVGPKAALSILSASTPAKGVDLCAGNWKENCPTDNFGTERQAGKGTDHLHAGGDLWRDRNYHYSRKQTLGSCRSLGSIGLFPK